MANSPSHRLGQIIGDALEAAIEPLLEEFAKKHGLYLDKKGPRPCRPGTKCSWVDINGNSHDLDFVLERGGSLERQGLPAAFIEVAWRRYTKHSRNKAQEIQGALAPLVEKHRHSGPFKGVILAGVFTKGALTQLESLGFTLLYFSYGSVVEVFRKFGIDAAYDEETPVKSLKKKVDAFENLGPKAKALIPAALLKAHEGDAKKFMAALEKVVSRRIDRIIVLPLHGLSQELATIGEAVRFIQGYDVAHANPVVRYEIQIRYNNGDRIEAEFQAKEKAIEFLKTFQPIAVEELVNKAIKKS